ncbi:MAG: SapB/AmfS family lanthipeptide [Pseudonocardiaceae bacterium]
MEFVLQLQELETPAEIDDNSTLGIQDSALSLLLCE